MSGFGPFGSAPFGALGEYGPPPGVETLSDAIVMSAFVYRSLIESPQGDMVGNDGAVGVAVYPLAESATATATIAGFDVLALLEQVALVGSAAPYLSAVSNLEQGIQFEDTLQIAWAMLLAADMQLADSVAGNPILLGAMIDTLHATGAAQSRLDALAAVAGSIAMEAMIQQGWSIEAMDSVAFNDALATTAKLIGPLVDAAALAGSAGHAMRLVAVGSESARLVGDAEARAVLQAQASDGILLYATLSIGGEEYAGWVMNTTTRGVSEYRQFAFESVCFWRGRTFLAGHGGIYEQTGDDDAGDPIEAFIRTGLTDFGAGQQKRLPDVYYAVTGTGRVVLKVVTTDPNGALVEDWYESDGAAADFREGRFKPGRGLKTRYLQFELHNTAGGKLDYLALDWRPLILDRRVK